MDSYIFRKLTFGIFFGVFLPFCIIFHYPLISGIVTLVFRIIGFIIILFTALLAFYIHSHFPKTHEKPEDFGNIMTDGLYKYVRHPFYSCFILMGFGIALFFLSMPGIIFNLMFVLVWEKLAEKEEKELLEYWGENYREFMKNRGRFFPKLFKKKNLKS